MTQILFDLAYLDAFFAFGGRSPIPLLVGVWPMPSLQLAVRIHNEVPGSSCPSRCRSGCAQRARRARSAASELIEEARGKAAGVYLVAPFRQPLGILDVL